MSGQTDLWTLAVIAGMTCVTVLVRCFFFILDREWTLAPWANHALRYAPVAALAAVVAPEVVMTGGQLVSTWQDARLFSAAAGALIFFWRRSVVATLVGCAFAWAGFFLPSFARVSDYAWFVGFGLAGALYLLLMRVAPPRVRSS